MTCKFERDHLASRKIKMECLGFNTCSPLTSDFLLLKTHISSLLLKNLLLSGGAICRKISGFSPESYTLSGSPHPHLTKSLSLPYQIIQTIKILPIIACNSEGFGCALETCFCLHLDVKLEICLQETTLWSSRGSQTKKKCCVIKNPSIRAQDWQECTESTFVPSKSNENEKEMFRNEWVVSQVRDLWRWEAQPDHESDPAWKVLDGARGLLPLWLK